ncbi:hypothetical protein IU11_17900, partial [Cellulosimicrobium sp. MM]
AVADARERLLGGVVLGEHPAPEVLPDEPARLDGVEVGGDGERRALARGRSSGATVAASSSATASSATARRSPAVDAK